MKYTREYILSLQKKAIEIRKENERKKATETLLEIEIDLESESIYVAERLEVLLNQKVKWLKRSTRAYYPFSFTNEGIKEILDSVYEISQDSIIWNQIKDTADICQIYLPSNIITKKNYDCIMHHQLSLFRLSIVSKILLESGLRLIYNNDSLPIEARVYINDFLPVVKKTEDYTKIFIPNQKY